MKSTRYIDTSTITPPVIMHLGTKFFAGRENRHNPNNGALHLSQRQDKEAPPSPTPDIKCNAPSCISKRLAMAFCSECCQHLCDDCLDRHNSEVLFQDHQSFPLAKRATTLPSHSRLQADLCPNPEHQNRPLSFYCKTCRVPVCNSCLQGLHAGHAHDTLMTTTTTTTIPPTMDPRDHSQRLRETLEAARNLLTQLKAAINSHDDGMLKVEASKVSAITLIVTTFRELQHSLERRRQMLLEKLERVVAGKKDGLAHRREELKRVYDELTQLSETVLRDPGGGNLDAAACKVMATQEKYTHGVSLSNLSTSINVSMDTAWLMERVDHFGIIDDCAPSLSRWSHESPPVANQPCLLEVETKDSSGRLKRVGDLDLRVDMRDRFDKAMSAQVADHRDGTYTAKLTPEGVGHQHLSITVNGQHIQNSPCDYHISTRDYLMLSNIRKTYDVKQPQYVAVDNSGCLYVSSYRRSHHHGYVDVLNSDGTRKLAIGCYGNSCGLLDSPRGVAVRGEEIFVADCGNHKVLKMTTSGKLLLSFGRTGEGEGSLKRPVGLCVDAEGHVIVADSGNHRIQIFNTDGNHLRSIQGNKDCAFGMTLSRNSRSLTTQDAATLGQALKDSSFYSPYGVALDPNGNIHVAANNSSSVKVFTLAGDFVRMYGILSGPTGIAIDSAGFSFVCQSSTSSPSSSASSPSFSSTSHSSPSPTWIGNGPGSALVVFDPKGNQIKVLHGVQGAYGVTVDKDGNVFVADWIKNQVVLY